MSAPPAQTEPAGASSPHGASPSETDVEDESASDHIGRSAGRGFKWSLVGTMATKVGSFVMGLILARLLHPADFGTYAIALAALQFVIHVNDVGLIAATVQWRGKLEDMAPTAATLAIAFSVVIYGAFWVAAPTFATLAGNPDAAPLVRLLTVVILIDGVTAVRSAALMRTFRQDKLIVANMAGLVLNATLAIGLAASGAGPFSFAVGQVGGAVVTGVLVFVLAKVPVKIGFDKAIAKKLMVFGIPLAASLGVEAILLNADFVIVGNVMGATALGFYLLAFNVSSWAPSIIGTAVRYVSVAGFSRLSEESDDSLSRGVQRTVPLLVTGIVPIVALVAALAPSLVYVLYGAEWGPAAHVLRILVILTVVRMLTSFALDILMGAGATRWGLWMNLAWAVTLIPALWLGTHAFGLNGAAIGHAIAGVMVALPLAGLALYKVGVKLGPIGPALIRPVLAGVLAGGVALLVAHFLDSNPYFQLLVAGSLGMVVYVAVAVPSETLRQWSTVMRRRKAYAVD